MSDAFANADTANRLANLIRFGHLTEIDLTSTPASARVEFEEGWVSDFLPVFQIYAGRVSAWSAPRPYEQVIVFSPSGEAAAGVALRGLNFDGRPAPSAEDLLTVLAEWEDGAADRYNEADRTRTLTVPAGGKLHLIAGAATVKIEDGVILIDGAGAPVLVKGDPITLDGPVNLGGSGGAAVARVGDSVVAGKIATGSSTVKAS
jgi:phage baseplate assembly protein V